MRGVGVWAVLVTGVLQIGGWIADEIPAALSLPRPPSWVWAMLCLVNAVLVFAPAELLSQRGRTAPARMAGQIWATAAAALALMGLARLVPIPHDELSLGSLAVITGLVAFGVRLFRGWTSPEGRPSGWAVAVGLTCLLPWLVFGALGGRLETLMAVLAGIATGALARSVLDGRFWAAYGTDQLVAGTVAGVALCVLAAGVGAFGVNILELLVLPPLGYVAARLRHTWLLVAIVALGPLAFVDPEELNFVLGFSDVLFYGIVSALCSLALAAMAAFVLPRTLKRGLAAALVMTVVAGCAYTLLGNPDFYGNRLFVIMKAQADVGGLSGPAAVHRKLVDTAEASQAELRGTLRDRHIPFTPYYLVNAIELDGGPVLRLRLAARPDVARVLISQRLRPIWQRGAPAGGTLGPPDGPTWDIRAIGADRVWRDLGVRGAGTLVGHVDTGADATHPALADGYRGGPDSWYDPWYHSARPTDLDGHGTGTASLAVGRGGVGVAPDARWIGCSNTARNMASPGLHLDCLQFVFAPFPAGGDPFRGDPARGARILTNSWDCTDEEGCDAQSLYPAARALEAAGVFVTAAAGNSGPFCRSITEPLATYPQVVTVGATNEQDQVAPYSSRGPVGPLIKPDILAPGTDVVLARPGGGYGTAFGTSMSAPLVAGVVALMWSANPALVGDLARTRQILTATARPTEPAPPSHLLFQRRKCGKVGNPGIVDAYAAVSMARAGT
ncbi:S8 family serine peptidase [Longispora sp. NPDC051575]|uniref:S8 family serine peptidase n=1 Tax=Longispora sp. NPDC051575 TaxID=3154943 RepID=UPI003436F880